MASPRAEPDPVLSAEAALITASSTLPPLITASSIFPSPISSISAFERSQRVNAGIVGLLTRLPGGSAILASAGVKRVDLAAQPTQALNIPGYGNWTDSGWNLRVHENIFKQPVISEERINDLTNVFLVDTKIEELPPSQSAQAANLTRSIFRFPQDILEVIVDIELAPAGFNGKQDGGGGVTPSEGSQRITLRNETRFQSGFDVFGSISDQGFANGNTTGPPQRINVYVNGTEAGNATSYLVPTEGLTVISDVDDILRVTKVHLGKESLLNFFARPYTPWMNMPDIFANWSTTLPETHFHYLTATPEQVTRSYMEFVYANYPGGSFDTRPSRFVSVTTSSRDVGKVLLVKIFQTYPRREFVLVGDTVNSGFLEAYPAIAKSYPGQVKCILIRNVSSTDDDAKGSYNTTDFAGLDPQKYMFFREPNDLVNLDISNGQCYNWTIPQNVTFGIQKPIRPKSAGSVTKVSENCFGVFIGVSMAFAGVIVFSGGW